MPYVFFTTLITHIVAFSELAPQDCNFAAKLSKCIIAYLSILMQVHTPSAISPPKFQTNLYPATFFGYVPHGSQFHQIFCHLQCYIFIHSLIYISNKRSLQNTIGHRLPDRKVFQQLPSEFQHMETVKNLKVCVTHMKS